MVHLQALQADIHHAHEIVVRARADLAGQPQPCTAALLEHFADPQLALAVRAVTVAGIDVGDAEVERVIQGDQTWTFPVTDEAAATAERQ